MNDSLVKDEYLIEYYHKNPKMLSSPYTYHIDLFYRDNIRISSLGKEVFSKFDFIDAKVFDLGCGIGGFLAYAKEKGAIECVGYDQDYYVIPENLKLIDSLEISSKLPFDQPSNYYDIVCCSEVLEHTGDLWKYYLKELIRILKVNGVLFISTPNYLNLCGILKWVMEMSNHYQKDTWAPFQSYKPQANEKPMKSFKILNELHRYPIKIIDKKSIWWLDGWAPWIHKYPEIKLYTGFIAKLREIFDKIFMKIPYCGLQFYCFAKKTHRSHQFTSIKNQLIEILDLINEKKIGKSLQIILNLLQNDIPDALKYDLIFLEGILWELLESYQKSLVCYEQAIRFKPQDFSLLQYKAHLLSKKGDSYSARIIFQKILNSVINGNNPLNCRRNILGFRYKSDDIKSLEEFIPKNTNDKENKYFLLGIYYFSIQKYEKANYNFNQLKSDFQDNSQAIILLCVGSFFISGDVNDLKPLYDMKIDSVNPLEKKINDYTQSLNNSLQSLNGHQSFFKYEIEIPEQLTTCLSKIKGWLDPYEANFLYQILKHMSNSRKKVKAMEIGGFLGKSAVAMGLALTKLNNGILFSIDPHNGIPFYHPIPTLMGFKKNIKEAGVSERIKILKGTSKHWLNDFKEKLDFLFIDGDHSVDSINFDFINWSKKVMENGLIAFHDSFLEGPFRVIIEAVETGKFEFVSIVGTISLLKKKEIKENENKLSIISKLNIILLCINRINYLTFLSQDRDILIQKAQEIVKKKIQ